MGAEIVHMYTHELTQYCSLDRKIGLGALKVTFYLTTMLETVQ